MDSVCICAFETCQAFHHLNPTAGRLALDFAEAKRHIPSWKPKYNMSLGPVELHGASFSKVQNSESLTAALRDPVCMLEPVTGWRAFEAHMCLGSKPRSLEVCANSANLTAFFMDTTPRSKKGMCCAML
jgi:hypothetical protein